MDLGRLNMGRGKTRWERETSIFEARLGWNVNGLYNMAVGGVVRLGKHPRLPFPSRQG